VPAVLQLPEARQRRLHKATVPRNGRLVKGRSISRWTYNVSNTHALLMCSTGFDRIEVAVPGRSNVESAGVLMTAA
jgi:hypothetical protein